MPVFCLVGLVAVNQLAESINDGWTNGWMDLKGQNFTFLFAFLTDVTHWCLSPNYSMVHCSSHSTLLTSASCLFFFFLFVLFSFCFSLLFSPLSLGARSLHFFLSVSPLLYLVLASPFFSFPLHFLSASLSKTMRVAGCTSGNRLGKLEMRQK